MRTLLFAVSLGLATGVAQAAASGEALVRSQCAQCHTLAKGEPHGVGPNLHGLIGRPVASVPGFTFSEKFISATRGKTWDARLLDAWLKDTQAVAPGNGMTYFQDDAAKRKAMVRYFQETKP